MAEVLVILEGNPLINKAMIVDLAKQITSLRGPEVSLVTEYEILRDDEGVSVEAGKQRTEMIFALSDVQALGVEEIFKEKFPGGEVLVLDDPYACLD